MRTLGSASGSKFGTGISSRDKRIILSVFFVIYLALSAFLIVIHEPWRDEIHAWFMAKYMTIPEMISFSRYDGHPIFWHLLIRPFARLGAPIWTMHLVSYVIVAVSAYLFLFKTNISAIVKTIALFTLPFLYTYSSISRNYCLVLILGVSICVMYPKRYERPLLYSVLISLTVFSHALAWGFVAGLTITFHIYEIVLKMARKSSLDKKVFRRIIIGFILIVISTVTVVVTLYGTENPTYSVQDDPYTNKVVLSLLILMLATLVILVLAKFKIWKEVVIHVLTLGFMVLIYTKHYSGILLPRLILIQVFLLCFMMLIDNCGFDVKKLVRIAAAVVFFASFFMCSSLADTFSCIKDDILWNYSSGKEMAEYINTNLPDEDMILVDGSTYVKSIMPYTEKKFYDISHKADKVEAMFTANDYALFVESLKDIDNHSEYKGKYLICYYAMPELPYEEVYRTSGSIMGEDYVLYRIPEQ